MAKAAVPPAKAELVPYELLYPAEEAQKAVKLTQDEISSHQNQLDRLRIFSAENTDLINLVRRLPDQLSHEIMVPFGKAAFFPGRLIHTNEFLVFLGEGYYAEQTAKQTIGVLRRRGEVLDSKVDGLNAIISDLKARAKFYDVTANESGEGMVEIREYEELQSQKKGNSDVNVRMTITDEEYAQVLAGLDELEMAELAAESASHDSGDESEETKVEHSKLQGLIENDLKLQEGQQIKTVEQKSKAHEGFPQKTPVQPYDSLSEQTQCENPNLSLRESFTWIKADEKTKPSTQLDIKDCLLLSSSQSTGKSSAMAGDGSIQEKPPKKEKFPAEEPTVGTPMSSYGRQGAFTGTIVEHTTGLTSNSPSQDPSQARASNPSKPVSRFKLQKGR